MKNKEFVMEWLKRAKSNLERAKAGRISKDVLYEDLCFDCQQSAEKAIKALLISIDKRFPPIHSIARLLELLSETDIEIPEKVKKTIDLTDYAVETRYPRKREAITKKEYKRALDIAKNVFNWVSEIIEKNEN